MQKTLGGDRLGSGKKIKVELHGYERSTHDLGYIWRSTMSPGTLVPFMAKLAQPGDTWDINLDCDMKTHPTIGPLFASYKVQLDTFQAPIRLYNSLLHNNAINIGRNMSQVKLPQMILKNTNVDAVVLDPNGDLDNSQINPSSILAYLGIRGVGLGAGDTEREFNAVSFLAYWEIYKQYYANKQEEIGAVIHSTRGALVNTVDTIQAESDVGTTGIPLAPLVSLVQLTQGYKIRVNYTGAAPLATQIILQFQYGGTRQLSEVARLVSDAAGVQRYEWNYRSFGTDYAISWRYREATDMNITPPVVQTFPLENIDAMRAEILAYPGTSAYILNSASLIPYQWPITTVQGALNAMTSQEGLAIKTYQSDLFNNWLSTEWIDGPGGIAEVTAIDTSGGSFSIDTLNLSKKVYDMLNRIAVSGGTYDDWLDVVYDHDRYQRCESPMYCGGLIKELVFQEVVSNAGSEGTTPQPLGTLAGKGIMAKKHKGGSVVIKVDEPSYIIGLISLTPRIDYSQGNQWDTMLKTLDDIHKPALDEIGFQELIKEQMAWWDTRYAGGIWTQFSAGKQPAWMNYMTDVNVTRGNFAIERNEMFMTLNRKYEYDGSTGIFDMTTYIDPVKYNNIFAETSIDAQNFWAQIAVDITCRRKISAKIMPNL